MKTRRSPLRLLVGGFLTLIAVGTILLCLPASTPTGRPIGFVDALFTSTSAVCVTGLVVRDTGSDFTLLGQIVILALIQLGGLGIMTSSLVVLSALGRRLSLTSRSVLSVTLSGAGRHGGLGSLLRLVVGFTLTCELGGAALLWLRWRWWPGGSLGPWEAVFHSVSAFCNAGFALWPGSLRAFRDDVATNAVVMALIVLGGLGFLVVHEIRRRSRREVVSLHTKLAVVTTGWLLAAGTLAIWFLERDDGLSGLSLGSQLLASVFQSTTARTAGFDTVDLTSFTPAGLFVLMLLMFVGGSPGSCAGGIKTTTLGVLVLAAWSRIRGRSHVNVFRRTLSRVTLENAVTVTLGGLTVVLLGGLVLVSIQAPHSAVRDLHGEFAAYLFEVVSAVGTVGLSLGATPTLTAGGRVLVALLMFLGRVGPLTVALALARECPETDWQQAEEDVMVG